MSHLHKSAGVTKFLGDSFRASSEKVGKLRLSGCLAEVGVPLNFLILSFLLLVLHTCSLLLSGYRL